jgi:hypothetical protein
MPERAKLYGVSRQHIVSLLFLFRWTSIGIASQGRPNKRSHCFKRLAQTKRCSAHLGRLDIGHQGVSKTASALRLPM